MSITVLATGFPTDFFDGDEEKGTGLGLESLQLDSVAAPKTVSGARKFAEKPLIPSQLTEEDDDDESSDAVPVPRFKRGSDQSSSGSGGGSGEGRKGFGLIRGLKSLLRKVLGG
jgi:hypothetical protein